MSIVFDILPDVSDLPCGQHSARLAQIELVDANPEKGYKAGVRYTFEVIGSDYKGCRVSRTTDRNFRPNRVAGKFLSSIVGKGLETGQVDAAPFIGKTYLIQVQLGQTGNPRVESASLIPV